MTREALLLKWQNSFSTLPLIAILRGITPDECVDVAEVIFSQGFEILEVPLNSPDAYASITKLRNRYPEKIIGAGTVTTVAEFEGCISVGCELIVTPNFTVEIANATKSQAVIFCPGVATPSEAFAALSVGVDGLKLFPAELITPSVVKALRAVLPKSTRLIPVGGITPDNMEEYLSAGASGFGLGSALYTPGKLLKDIRDSARKFAAIINS